MTSNTELPQNQIVRREEHRESRKHEGDCWDVLSTLLKIRLTDHIRFIVSRRNHFGSVSLRRNERRSIVDVYS